MIQTFTLSSPRILIIFTWVRAVREPSPRLKISLDVITVNEFLPIRLLLQCTAFCIILYAFPCGCCFESMWYITQNLESEVLEYRHIVPFASSVASYMSFQFSDSLLSVN